MMFYFWGEGLSKNGDGIQRLSILSATHKVCMSVLKNTLFFIVIKWRIIRVYMRKLLVYFLLKWRMFNWVLNIWGSYLNQMSIVNRTGFVL